ncbi:MAG: uracil-DNA glycosylase family protein [Gammaproteobacteria bacterium]|nr:uracil-DNA glycosylase family protein [Gammaproteobacteria bacterium]
MNELKSLLARVRQCRICESDLPLGSRPVLQCSASAKILIAGQAPGSKVHVSGVPFDDPSGNRLRDWLGISRETFYDASQVAILPMGFCYPGTGKSGDLPPRPECAPEWRGSLLTHLKQLQMILVLGQYAQHYHFETKLASLTERVKSWRDYWPLVVPLPHPSPRNNRWLKQNPWFEEELLPELQKRVIQILNGKNND